jgi:hypothetical protein
MIGQGQAQYFYTPPQQFNPELWQVAPLQAQQPTVGELLVDLLGKVVVVGIGVAVVYAGCELLFGTDKPVRHCSECGRTNHTARNCPLTGPRTRLQIQKSGNCACCGGSYRYTEGHHYAGRGDSSKGKEMCAPCHFHCGHNGDWYNFPVNPRYCRLAA